MFHVKHFSLYYGWDKSENSSPACTAIADRTIVHLVSRETMR